VRGSVIGMELGLLPNGSLLTYSLLPGARQSRPILPANDPPSLRPALLSFETVTVLANSP